MSEGNFPIRTDISVLPGDASGEPQLGWKLSEEIEIVFINDLCLQTICFDSPVLEEHPVIEKSLEIENYSYLFGDIKKRFNLMDI